MTKAKRRWTLELLEARQMLAAHVVLSEMMAINTSTLLDEDGSPSDWIELRNLGDESQDLSGWHLTNDAGNLGRWTLPAVSLAAGESLVVFASGKNRTNPVGTLHTNFELPASGGYLAFSRADQSIVNQIGPNYPVQVADVSFGPGAISANSTALATGAAAKYRVPSGPADLGDWTNPTYNDNAWTAASTGLGFDSEGASAAYPSVVLADNPIHYYRFEEATTIVPAKDEIGGGANGANPGAYTGGITLSQPSFAPSFGSAARFSGVSGTYVNLGTPFHPGDSTTVEAWVWLDPAANKAFHAIVARWDGSYELDVNRDQGAGNFVTRSTGNAFAAAQTSAFTYGQWHHMVGVFDAATGATTVFLDGVAGSSQIAGGVLQNQGGTLYIGATRDGAASGFNWTGLIDEVAIYNRALAPVEIAEHYQAATGSVAGVDFTSQIATNVEAAMRDVNSSVAVRSRFTVADPAAIDELTLRMKYDDGFVAYLNGHEVARRNAPAGAPAWNAAAIAERDNTAAIAFEEFDISAYRQYLLAGAAANVLSIVGLNISAGQRDFLVVPEVVATDDDFLDLVGPAQYFVLPTPGTANSNSSAGAPRIDHVSITEVMSLNNGALLDEDGDESDWIELYNSGPYAVDLNNSYLTQDANDLTGWHFPRGSVIAPGGYLLVFASGKDRNRGELHTDFKLDNDGEYLALVRADGASIVSQFAPQLPSMLPNASYGRPAETVAMPLVTSTSVGRYRVATTAADMPANWNTVGFNDSAWPAHAGGIGFDTNGGGSYAASVLADSPAHYWRLEEAATSQAAADQGTPGGNAGTFIGGVALGQSSAAPLLGNAARFDGVETAPNGSRIDVGTFHVGDNITVEAWVMLDPTANKTVHTIASRWDGSWSLDVIGSTKRGSFTVRNASNQLGTAQTTAALVPGQWHHLVGVFAGGVVTAYLDGIAGTPNNRGGALRNAGPTPDRVLIGAARTGSASGSNNWTGLIDEVAVYPTGLSAAQIQQHRTAAVSANLDLTPAVATNIAAAMHNAGSVALLRTPFVVADPAAIDELTLQVKYDDGFVAYLNGQEVARRNAPGASGTAVAFNTIASAAHADSAALAAETIDLAEFRGALVTGNNVLAIAGLNLAANDPDFLMSATLAGVDTGNYAAAAPDRFFVAPTPGALNSTGALDRGPVIGEVSHTPNQPSDTDDLVVTTRVRPVSSSVGGGIGSVTLRYRVMFAAEVAAPMRDDGTLRDAVAGDGIYTGVIPATAYAPGEMVRYYVSAADATGNPSRWPLFPDPAESDQYLGTVVLDPAVTSPLSVLHWFVQDTAAADSPNQTGTRASLFYLGEFYDNVFVRTRGATAVTYPKRPYKFDFHQGHFFRYRADAPRVEEINVNSTYQDKALVRAPLSMETYRAAGVPASDAFNLRVERNGDFFSVAVMVEQVDDGFLERRGFDPNGAMYKLVSFNGITSATVNVEKKTQQDQPNTDLAALVAGLALNNPNRANVVVDSFDLPAIVNYLATGILFQDFDRTIKNYYLYRNPADDEWQIFPWDKDLTFGLQGLTTDVVQGNNDAGTFGHPWFGTTDRNCCGVNNLMDAVYDTPALRELVMRRLRTLMDEFLQAPGTPVDELFYERRLNELYPTLSADAALDLAKWGPGFGATQSLATAMNVIKTNYLAERRVHLYQTHSIDNLPGAGGSTLISGLPGATTASYFVPVDNSLATSWTAINFAPAAAWPTGPTGIGYEATPADYVGLIATAVRPQDACVDCTSVYVRIPFNVANPEAINNLTLRMKYDDGFVAYLNGQEVARRNVTGSAVYNTLAGDHPDTAAVVFEDIAISSAALVAGTNMLAIHAINSGAGSSDMLVLPELVQGLTGYAQSAGIPHAQADHPAIQFGAMDVNPASHDQEQEYIQLTNPNATAVDISGWKLAGGVTFTFAAGTVIPALGSIYVSADVRAFRARSTGPSAGQGLQVVGPYTGHLSNFGETIDLLAADDTVVSSTVTPVIPTDAQRYLRVSEIMYHPANASEAEFAAGFADQDDFEYIELANTSSGPSAVSLDLSGVRFTSGVDFDFTGSAITTLAPGEHLLVVRNAAAMAARYGAGLSIAGEFATGTGLSNSGEAIALEDAEGNTIHDFVYDDAGPLWHASTDGDGPSLVIRDETGPLARWNAGDGWRPSFASGGSPGMKDHLAGDVDDNERVDLSDIAILQAHLGTPSGSLWSDGDLNGDGAVNRTDAAILARNFGRAYVAPAAPAAVLVAVRQSLGEHAAERPPLSAIRAVRRPVEPRDSSASVDLAMDAAATWLSTGNVNAVLPLRAARVRGAIVRRG